MLNYRSVCGYKWLFLFLAMALLSIVFAPDLKRAVTIFLLYLLMASFYIVLTLILKKIDKPFSFWARLILIIGTLLSLFALWQFHADMYGMGFTFLRESYSKKIFGFPRPHATFMEPLYFANFLFLPIFSGYYLLLKERRATDWAMLVLVLLVFFLTLSRGACLGLVFATLLIGVYSVRARAWSSLGKWIGSVVLAFCLAILLVSVYSGKSSAFLEQLASVGKLSDSGTYGQIVSLDTQRQESDFVLLSSREYTTSVALKTIPKHFFGVGVGNFGNLPEFTPLIEKGSHQIVNNLYLEILVENGWIGFIAFMLFLLVIFRLLFVRLWQGEIIAASLAAMMGAIFFQYLFFSTFYMTYIFVALAIACLSAKGKWSES
ncbi:MAG TPA: O-antigen ligase family protein [bacterium]|nr:O-antigen ligase family protein [bacterium]